MMVVVVVGGGAVPSLDVVPPTVFRLLPNCWLRWLQVLTHEVQWIIESAAPRRLCRWRRNGELLRIIVVLMWVWVGRDGARVVVGTALLLKLSEMLLQSFLWRDVVQDLVRSWVELKVGGRPCRLPCRSLPLPLHRLPGCCRSRGCCCALPEAQQWNPHRRLELWILCSSRRGRC